MLTRRRRARVPGPIGLKLKVETNSEYCSQHEVSNKLKQVKRRVEFAHIELDSTAADYVLAEFVDAQ